MTGGPRNKTIEGAALMKESFFLLGTTYLYRHDNKLIKKVEKASKEKSENCHGKCGHVLSKWYLCTVLGSANTRRNWLEDSYQKPYGNTSICHDSENKQKLHVPGLSSLDWDGAGSSSQVGYLGVLGHENATRIYSLVGQSLHAISRLIHSKGSTQSSGL